ncbi:beta-ketoacyl-ACP synthase I [Salmonella enterica]|uniref:3-oxoacyl-[acyl-carrier-protein] synthase 1 n=1 Tax=Salmonella enterica subsp. houtenae serovar 18:z36,z38:- TaxID=2577510 RepID=A0A729Q588_SALHO|nr:beta-ketoacyl-ACP synthase I [Salmonella enterica]EAW2231704.1 beta-ketoacyl-ACP synthase I [Salmonella enterica subsp. enterica]ECC1641051.1 beta-ketoacyl-ACP synthase I [Salmonella enterica subsp. houtenae]EEC0939848.1 beta-ketoacyl-ACP synthase I [Salmonella enterica subsp. enterica serovar Baguida]EEP3162832.1 beta-ketoacyl-ACP synthase I [Salmonella enterica subsp. houtenae serovar 43:z4,z32:-]MBA2164640.1 beta-ketoacyl-ACP synthase I [Salmonella enterica subsp. houtenae serovar 18:z36
MKRAVITGLGIVSSIGNNQQEVLASLREGRSGITFSQELKDAGMRSQVWGNVKLDTTGLIDRKVVRFMSDASIYAYLSMEQAVADAGLAPEVYQNNPRVGLIAGSGGGSPKFQVFGADAMRSPRGLKAVGPYVVTKAMASGVSACLATPFKIYGVNYSISSACATSAHCIGNAVEQIQLGKQDIVFAGGGEELCWEMACEFDAMGALSTKYNDTPEKASRTYDAHRDGFVIAGGGGMVVVEELEHALARGAHIYAEIVGYGATSDGADMVAPSGEGAVRCMQMAMHGVDTPIDYLNSHGTSTPVGDVKELGAIREVFGDKSPAISATKAMTGHSLGAAGVQETIYSLLMLEHDFIAPSINIEEMDEQATGLNIVTKTTERKLTTVMSNSFGFGGTNATLVMRKLKA